MRIKWNNQGFYDIRHAPGVQRDLNNRAARIAAAAGDGYRTSSMQGARKPQGRWRATVITATYKAKRDNAKNNTLLRSLDRGR